MPPSATAQAQIDRANKVLKEGSKVNPGCKTCRSLGRSCIIYPPGEGRLNKCYQCTLSKQSCSIDRKTNSAEYEKQSFVRSDENHSIDDCPVDDRSVDDRSVNDRSVDDRSVEYSEGSPKEIPQFDMLEIAQSAINKADRSNKDRSTAIQIIMKLDRTIAQVKGILEDLEQLRNEIV